MEKNKTAVEWFEDKLYDLIHPEHRNEYFLILNQAKQMEKEQIKNSFDNGYYEGSVGGARKGEYYYNETYKNTGNE